MLDSQPDVVQPASACPAVRVVRAGLWRQAGMKDGAPRGASRRLVWLNQTAEAVGTGGRGASPREVGEGLVGVGHAVGLLTGVHGLALLLEGGHELVGEAVGHRAP